MHTGKNQERKNFLCKKLGSSWSTSLLVVKKGRPTKGKSVFFLCLEQQEGLLSTH